MKEKTKPEAWSNLSPPEKAQWPYGLGNYGEWSWAAQHAKPEGWVNGEDELDEEDND